MIPWFYDSISQNHRMVEVVRDLWRPSSPTTLLKQIHGEQHCTGCHPGRFWLSLRAGESTATLRHPQSTEIFLHVQMELPMFQLVPVAPFPVAGHHWKESDPILLTPILKMIIIICKIPCQSSLLQAEWAQLPGPFLIREMLQSLLIFVTLHWTLSSSSSSSLKW